MRDVRGEPGALTAQLVAIDPVDRAPIRRVAPSHEIVTACGVGRSGTPGHGARNA